MNKIALLFLAFLFSASSRAQNLCQAIYAPKNFASSALQQKINYRINNLQLINRHYLELVRLKSAPQLQETALQEFMHLDLLTRTELNSRMSETQSVAEAQALAVTLEAYFAMDRFYPGDKALHILQRIYLENLKDLEKFKSEFYYFKQRFHLSAEQNPVLAVNKYADEAEALLQQAGYLTAPLIKSILNVKSQLHIEALKVLIAYKVQGLDEKIPIITQFTNVHQLHALQTVLVRRQSVDSILILFLQFKDSSQVEALFKMIKMGQPSADDIQTILH